MSSNSRSVRIPQEEWEKYRTEITSLFQDHTYAQIIDHLGKKHNFHPSANQFGTQVQRRWNLQKNVKAQLQVDAFAKVQEREGRPTEILINNRPIPAKKLRKTATAMATAQKRKAEENAHVAPVQMQSGQHKRPRRTPVGPDGLAGEDLVPHPASPDNIIVRTPPAVETPTASSENIIVRTPPAVDILTASPVPTSSSLAQAHPHSSPFFTFNAWFQNTAACLTEMLYLPSLDTFHPQGLRTSQLNYSGELRQTSSRDLSLFFGTELNPNMQDPANETVSRLQHITLQLARKGLVQNVSISPNLSKFETSLQLLLPMIELASNNLLPTSTVRELLRWISNQRLLWVVEALIDNQLPTTAAFASVLFNGSVDIGDTEIARALLAKGVDPNSRAKPSNGPRKSPLQEAITNADAAMVRLLLSFGARVTNATVVSRRTGWHPSRTDLDIASEGPRMCVTTIELLLQHGDSPNVPIPEGCHFTTSVLNRALELQEMEVVKKLLSAGALTNDHHCGHSVTALQTAAKYCDSDAVQLLIDAGADFDIPCGIDNRIARKVAEMIRNHEFFMTPLQHATKRNDIAIAKVLLDNHASVDGFDFHQFFPQGYNAERDDWGSVCSDNDSDSDTANYDAFAEERFSYYRGGDDGKDVSVFEQQSQLYSPL